MCDANAGYSGGERYGKYVVNDSDAVFWGDWSGHPWDANFHLRGTILTTDVNEQNNLPVQFVLEQNYPNPFNPSTKIRFVIPNEVRNLKDFSSQAPRNDNALVTLKVYDVLGNEVATLVNEEKTAGIYEFEFNAAGLSSGMYFYKLQAVPSISSDQGFVETKKMMLLK